MQQIIAGNWKMYGRLADISAYAASINRGPRHVKLLICPPFTLLERFAAALSGSAIALGAQNCHAASCGAHTGDISAPMLAEVGVSYVILGHSERREHQGETNAQVRAKAEAAQMAGLIPIICIGETAAQRDAGKAEDVVHQQLAESLPQTFSGAVAYEPVWAIGSGHTPTAENIIAMHSRIRNTLVERLGNIAGLVNILYGGSVKPGNAARLLALPEVGGALVGGASLHAEDFLAIAAAAPHS